MELELMERFKTHLESERPLRELDITEEQDKMIRGYGFLSSKPVLVVANLGDEPKAVNTLLKYDHPQTRLVEFAGTD